MRKEGKKWKRERHTHRHRRARDREADRKNEWKRDRDDDESGMYNRANEKRRERYNENGKRRGGVWNVPELHPCTALLAI
jgi:hypothetical protein